MFFWPFSGCAYAGAGCGLFFWFASFLPYLVPISFYFRFERGVVSISFSFLISPPFFVWEPFRSGPRIADKILWTRGFF